MRYSFTNNLTTLEAKAERFAQYHGIGRRGGQYWVDAIEEYLAQEPEPNSLFRFRTYHRQLWHRIVKRANA